MRRKPNNGMKTSLVPKVLILCDEPEVGRIWAHGLRQRKFDVDLVDSVNDVMRRWEAQIPDLIVLDVYDELEEAIAVCKELREESITPILLLTDRPEESHILAAYKAGVDECVIKPVSPGVFLAKVTAWLRRSWTMPLKALDGVQVGELRLDPVRRTVESSSGLQAKLTNLEFRLLHVLMAHPGWTFETGALIERIWGHTGDADRNLLKNVVYRLRRKLEADLEEPSLIMTDPGVGYKFLGQ